MEQAMSFGKPLKEREFFLDSDSIHLNHGSYGAVPKRVLREQISLFSLELSKEDAILTSNSSYHAVKRLVEAKGCRVIQLQIDFPIRSEEQILNLCREVLKNETCIKVAILDHITSPTAVVMPIQKLAAICREHDVITIADGAHGLMQVELNIEETGVDFYTGNIHKWLYVPRGAGFLWVSTPFLEKIRPGVVSHFHGNNIHYDFCVRGTRDDTAYYTLPAALEFCEELGGIDAIRQYMTALLDDAVNLLEKSWGTRRIEMPESMLAPGMRLIKLPDIPNYAKTSIGAGDLENDLYNQYKIQTLCAAINGELYVRLSGNVYNCIEDYRRLGEAVLELKDKPTRNKKDKRYHLPIMHWDLTPLISDI